MRSRYIKIILSLLIINSFVLIAADFPEWIVPAEVNQVKNPLGSEKRIIEDGEAIFKTTCIACHGTEGKGNGAIKSANLTEKVFQDQTDGAIYYKIATGRGTMPSFKTMPEENIWKVIHYLRTLNSSNASKILRNGTVQLTLDNKNITASFKEVKENVEVPAANIKVGVYAKRYFGLLPLSDGSIYTDSNGNISLICPADIPGDDEGNITVVARIEDFDFAPVSVEKEVNWGVILPQSEWENTWNNETALWRTNQYAPIWVKLSFFGITIGVWIGIFYVVFLMRRIKILGRKTE